MLRRGQASGPKRMLLICCVRLEGIEYIYSSERRTTDQGGGSIDWWTVVVEHQHEIFRVPGLSHNQINTDPWHRRNNEH